MTFGDLLRKLIEQSGNSISAAARGAEIERTTLQKALSGERTLPYPAMKKLAAYLRLTPHEQKIFCEYYDMQIQGPSSFESRKTIVRILRELSRLPIPEEKQKLVLTVRPGSEVEEKEEQKLITGVYAVRNRIRRMIDMELQEKNPELLLFMPADDGFTMYYLYNVLSEYETSLEITHIIPYGAAGESQGKEGLEILERVLPLALTAATRYHSYFYYNKYEVVATPFPYYLITAAGVLLISENYETACLLSSREMLEHFRYFFRQAAEQCSPLLQVQQNIFEILQTYAETVEKSSYYTFMRQPCLGKLYTPELIEKKIRQGIPFREKLVEESKKRFSELAETTGDYYTFFTEEGLREFLDTGVICDIPREAIDVLSMEERIFLLEKFRDAVADDSITGRMISDEQLVLPAYLSFSVSARNKLDIFTLQRYAGDERFYNIHIDEPFLGGKFMDFVLFLPKSEYVRSKEETLRRIDEMLAPF